MRCSAMHLHTDNYEERAEERAPLRISIAGCSIGYSRFGCGVGLAFRGAGAMAAATQLEPNRRIIPQILYAQRASTAVTGCVRLPVIRYYRVWRAKGQWTKVRETEVSRQGGVSQ